MMIWWQQMIGHLVIISKCAIRSFRERCSSVPHLRRSCHWPHHPLLLHPSWQVCNDFLAKLDLKLHLSIYQLFGTHKDISEYRPIIYKNLVGLTSVCWNIDSPGCSQAVAWPRESSEFSQIDLSSRQPSSSSLSTSWTGSRLEMLTTVSEWI